jgi:hypothetical protein
VNYLERQNSTPDRASAALFSRLHARAPDADSPPRGARCCLAHVVFALLLLCCVVQKGRVLQRDIDAFSCETARISFLFCLKRSLLRVITDNAPAIAAAGCAEVHFCCRALTRLP